MAQTLTQGVTLVGDQTLQFRVAMAFYRVARTVLIEPADTTGHEQRANFARTIVTQDYKQFLQYTAMVVTAPAIVAAGSTTAGQITDDQIITAVSDMWNALANVPPGT